RGDAPVSSDVLVAFGGIAFLGLVASLVALHLIRRDEARRRSNPSKEYSKQVPSLRSGQALRYALVPRVKIRSLAPSALGMTWLAFVQERKTGSSLARS